MHVKIYNFINIYNLKSKEHQQTIRSFVHRRKQFFKNHTISLKHLIMAMSGLEICRQNEEILK